MGLLAGRPDGQSTRTSRSTAWLEAVGWFMPLILGQHYAVGAAAPLADISAASRALMERLTAGILAVLVAIAADSAFRAALGRSRIAVKTERIPTSISPIDSQ